VTSREIRGDEKQLDRLLPAVELYRTLFVQGKPQPSHEHVDQQRAAGISAVGDRHSPGPDGGLSMKGGSISRCGVDDR
jgi:hypothetical protein